MEPTLSLILVRRLSMACGLMLTVLFCGCSKRPDDRPRTYRVTGKVTYQDKPVVGARVEFMGDGMPRAATGTTNEAGEYTLMTFEDGDGAVVGKHQVSVVKQNTGTTTVSELEGASYDQAMRQIADQSTKKTEPQNGGLPVKYARRDTSGVDFTVTAQGPNTFDIVLQD